MDNFSLGMCVGAIFILVSSYPFLKTSDAERQIKCLELEVGKEKCDLIFNFKKE